jgi:hypothetical protein
MTDRRTRGDSRRVQQGGPFMKFSMLAVAAVLAAPTFACSSGDTVDLGENEPGRTGEKLSDFAASWDGYAEAHSFESGSDRVRLVLDENGNGYLEIGDAPLLPPPTDPDVGYPPGALEGVSFNYWDKQGLGEGFHYTVVGTVLEASRLRLGVQGEELYDAACALYEPEPSVVPPGTGYSCVGANTFNMSPGENGQCLVQRVTNEAYAEVSVACSKLALCWGLCVCSADACSAGLSNTLEGASTRLDAALTDNGDTLVGTLLLPVFDENYDQGGRITLRLTRQ